MGAAADQGEKRPTSAARCCASVGGSDQNVAPWISRRIAKRYGAEQQDHPGKPHWIIAESAARRGGAAGPGLAAHERW